MAKEEEEKEEAEEEEDEEEEDDGEEEKEERKRRGGQRAPCSGATCKCLHLRLQLANSSFQGAVASNGGPLVGTSQDCRHASGGNAH